MIFKRVLLSSMLGALIAFGAILWEKYYPDSETNLAKEPLQADTFQMVRGDGTWCNIPLYGITEHEFYLNADHIQILRLCEVDRTFEVIAVSQGYGTFISARVPLNFDQEIGDISCKGSIYYPCRGKSEYLWLEIGVDLGAN